MVTLPSSMGSRVCWVPVLLLGSRGLKVLIVLWLPVYVVPIPKMPTSTLQPDRLLTRGYLMACRTKTLRTYNFTSSVLEVDV